jgi:hypothetical protein
MIWLSRISRSLGGCWDVLGKVAHLLLHRSDRPVGDEGVDVHLPRPTWLGDHAFPHRQRGERARPQLNTQVVQEPRDPNNLLDVGDRQAVQPGV